MVERYQNKRKEQQRETPEDEEHLKGAPNYANEISTASDVETLEEAYEDVESVIVDPPGYLTEQEPEGDDWNRRRPRVPAQPNIPQPDFGVDIDGLGTEGLLRFIAKVNVNMLMSLFDIANSVEPRDNIVISGTNAIEAADNPEPVVPKTDEVDIPTRQLLIKADSDNNRSIAFGDDTISPENGFVLRSGESIFIDIDLRGEELYMASEAAGQEVNLLGLL